MTRGDDSESKGPHPLGTARHELSSGTKNVRHFPCRCVIWIGFSTFLFITFVVGFIILDVTPPSKDLPTSKAKRFVTNGEPDPEVTQNDIEIIPENWDSDNRRMNQHQNHRYIVMEPSDTIYKKIMKDLYDESGWSPKPFEIQTEGTLTAVSKDEPRDQSSKEIELGTKRMRRLKPSMKLKGVYIRSESDEDMSEDPEDVRYPKEINHLMQNSHESGTGEGNWSLKKVFRGQGSPFQLPVKERGRLGKHHTKHSNPNGHRTKQRSKNKPLTILLGIYPMTEPGDYRRGEKFKHGKHHLSQAVYGESTNVVKYFHPHKGKNGMIMKLNLYPKNKRLWKRPRSGARRRGERPALGAYPHGKPITESP